MTAPDNEVATLAVWAGGPSALSTLTQRLYEKVAADPLLAPVFAHMSSEHAERVAQFIGEVFRGRSVKAIREYAVAGVLLLTGCATVELDAPVPSRLETAPGVVLHVEKYGDGPNVVIVPGRFLLGEPFRALASPDRTLILYDMRNRGASSRVESGDALTIIHDVEDLEAIRAQFGAERISLVGYSYLGLMTALYAEAHPERVDRLVQLGPVPMRYDTPYPPDLRAGADSLSEEGARAMADWERLRAASGADQRTLCAAQQRLSSYFVVVDPAKAAAFPDLCVYENEWPANFDRHLGFHFGDIQRRTFAPSQFEGLAQPVLVIHGRLDRNAPYGGGREWASTFANARLVTVADGAHNSWLDEPRVIADIDAFLGGAWPSAAEAVARSQPRP